MEIYISDRINTQILEALRNHSGGKIFGTFDESAGITAVTDFSCDGSLSSNDKDGDCQTSFINNERLVHTRMQLYDLETKSGPFTFKLVDGCLKVLLNSGQDRDNHLDSKIVIYKDADFFKRSPYNKAVMEHLEKKKVLIIGLGSVGSVIGRELGMAGAGSIIGMDKDTLEIHNCMRHILGPAFVGWPKPEAMRLYFEEQIPTCKFIPIFGDLFCKKNRPKLIDFMKQECPTHILAATDVLNVQYLCQRLAVEYELPFMAVWCDNNAVEGEIFMWEPTQARGWKEGRPKRGCYACLRPMDKVTITRSKHFDYSSDDPDSYGGEPALGTFINRINNISTIYMLAWLMQDCTERTKLASILDKEYEGLGLQYIRLGGPYLMNKSETITANNPWALEWYRVRKMGNCPICGNREENHNTLFPSLPTEDKWE